MKPSLLWDAGPGEIRAGLVDDGRLVELRLIRLRRGEKPLFAAGEHYTARILSRLGSKGALVTLGGGQEAILSPAPSLAEGELVAVEMVRSAVPEPGQWKLPKVRLLEGVESAKEPCWHFSAEPWELFLRRHAGLVASIACPNAQTANEVAALLGSAAPVISVDPGAISEADFETLLDETVQGEFPIENGQLTIERTRAMTVIDVDGTASALNLNMSATAEIARLLRLLDIGGPIGIDFISMNSRAARIQVDAALADACGPLGGHERTAINGFGFCQVIRPRTGPSVPELLCGTTPQRLSLESRAIGLLRQAGRSQGIGARRLVAPVPVIDIIRQWPEEVSALQFSLGAAIELVPDASATGYGHVHVIQG